MRWTLLTLALACALLDASHGSAQSPASEAALAISLRAILAAHPVPGARIAVAVALTDSGRELFAEGGDLAMNPASNAKIVTAAAALGLLGASATFSTTVTARVDGELARSLVLHGGGDPVLRARDLDALAADVAARGIRRVEGDVLLDDARYGGELLPPGFEQQPAEEAGFRPSVSALAVESGAFSVNLYGRAPGAPCLAWITPPEAAVAAGAALTAPSGAPLLRVDATSDPPSVAISGGCAVGTTAVRRRQSHPTVVAGRIFVQALRRYGVRVEGVSRVSVAAVEGELVASHRSQPLSTLLLEAGKHSNNFVAEMLLLALAPVGSVDASAAASARAVAWLGDRGVPARGLVLRNGSGLYDTDRVSARQLVGALRVPWRDPRIRHEFITHLAVAGEDGTLQHRLRARLTQGIVRAKTGTLDDVVALSGYVLSANSARGVAFSVMVNGCRGQTAAARALTDEVAVALARFAQAGR